MCTLTILRAAPPPAASASPSSLRFAFSRDEQRSRAAALPPALRTLAGTACLMPTDPDSGGSWIGASDAAVVAALLNATPVRHDPARFAGRLSRGSIVPGILAGGSWANALASARALDASLFPPFRLVLADRDHLAVIAADGHRLHITEPAPHADAALWTSSGLGDHLVQAPRAAEFERVVLASPGSAAQDRFHRHAAAPRHLSVHMARADARTVSLTVIDLAPDSLAMTYWPVDDHAGPIGPGVRVGLPLAPAGVAR